MIHSAITAVIYIVRDSEILTLDHLIDLIDNYATRVLNDRFYKNKYFKPD